MNYLSLIFAFFLILLTLIFAAFIVLKASEMTKGLESSLRDKYVKTRLKTYRRKIFYGK